MVLHHMAHGPSAYMENSPINYEICLRCPHLPIPLLDALNVCLFCLMDNLALMLMIRSYYCLNLFFKLVSLVF